MRGRGKKIWKGEGEEEEGKKASWEASESEREKPILILATDDELNVQFENSGKYILFCTATQYLHSEIQLFWWRGRFSSQSI